MNQCELDQFFQHCDPNLRFSLKSFIQIIKKLDLLPVFSEADRCMMALHTGIDVTVFVCHIIRSAVIINATETSGTVEIITRYLDGNICIPFPRVGEDVELYKGTGWKFNLKKWKEFLIIKIFKCCFFTACIAAL